MRVCLLAVILALLSLAARGHSAGFNQSHSVTWGARVFRDMHLERVIITEKSKLFRIVTRTYTFEQTGHHLRRITQIVITDQFDNGDGGYARLEAGGPQAFTAKIFFKSKRSKGFSFIVDIYGI